MPSVTIIIANWNGQFFLPTCLKALSAQTFTDFEVLVIDNGSTDGSVDTLQNDWPEVRLIQLESNQGFAAANNQGAKLAAGEWVAFLNNDAYPEPGWLTALLASAQAHPGCTAFSSRILLVDPPNLLDSTGDIYHISGNAWHRGYRHEAQDFNPPHGDVFSACAAAALYRKADFLASGGFDEDYFAYMEDIDLGFRLRLNNLFTHYVPDAVVRHVGSATAGIESEFTVYHVHRNLVWCYVTNMPGGYLWLYLPVHLISALIFMVYYAKHGLGKPYLKAKWDALVGLKVAIHKRKHVQSQRKVDPGTVVAGMDHGWFSPYILGRSSRRLRQWMAQSSPKGEALKMPLAEDICYHIPPGVLASQSGKYSYISTSQGGKVLVDRRVIELWQQADQQPLNTLVESLTEQGYLEIEVRAGLACLCQAGFLERHSAITHPGMLTSSQGPPVSVVIVSYNSQSWLEECLKSLAVQSYQPLEIIIVDNHSSDNTVAWTVANYPAIRLIQNDKTVSLAQAINRGIDLAQGAHFLILNPDVRLEPDALAILVQTAQQEPNAAAVAAKLKLTWTPGFLNGVGNLVGAFGFGSDIGLGHLDLGQFDGLRALPSTCFAAALLSRAAWQKVGPLDPAFPLYYEDSEWCYRARILGFSVLAAPQAIVYHALGSRTPDHQESGLSPTRLERVVYGRLRFANKLLSNPFRRRFTVRYLVEDSLRLLLAFVRLRGSQVRAIWQGWINYSRANDLHKIRAGLLTERQVDDDALFELQRGLPASLIWRGMPILTWDTIQSHYLPLIQAGKTFPLPEFPGDEKAVLPATGGLQRWNQIRRLEGITLLILRLYRALQWKLAQV